MKIFKYAVTDGWVAEIPSGAKVLHAAMQGNAITIWAAVDDTQPMVKVLFTILGTGANFTPSNVGDYCGTVFEGPFVWHIFGKALA